MLLLLLLLSLIFALFFMIIEFCSNNLLVLDKLKNEKCCEKEIFARANHQLPGNDNLYTEILPMKKQIPQHSMHKKAMSGMKFFFRFAFHFIE